MGWPEGHHELVQFNSIDKRCPMGSTLNLDELRDNIEHRIRESSNVENILTVDRLLMSIRRKVDANQLRTRISLFQLHPL